MRETKLSPLRLIAFVSPEAPFAALLMAVVVFVPPFYAGTVGLGLSTVGLIFGLTKLWDVITDPAFGVLSDRWHTKWGRRLPWLVASIPVLGLSIYMVFVPGASVGGIYFAFWMILLYIGWTIGSVSHIAWAAELSADYHERSRISAYKQGAALIGSLGLIMLIALSESVLGTDDAGRMATIAIALLVTLPLTIAAALWAVPEPIAHISPTSPSNGTVRHLVRNQPLRRLLVANLLIGVATGGAAGMVLFYVEDVLQLGSWSSFVLVPFLFSGLLFLPLFMRLGRRIGKHRTLCYALFYQMGASVLYLVLPTGSAWIAGVAFLMLGAMQAVGAFIPRAIMADVTDMDTAQSGKLQSGLYMSLLQSTSKIGAALAIGLSYPVLSLVGFDPSPGAINSDSALFGLRVIMVAFPGVTLSVVIWVMWAFPLDEKRQIAFRTQIATARAKTMEGTSIAGTLMPIAPNATADLGDGDVSKPAG